MARVRMMLVSIATSCITEANNKKSTQTKLIWTFQWKCGLEDVQKKNKCCVHTGLAKVWPKNKACFTSTRHWQQAQQIATTNISGYLNRNVAWKMIRISSIVLYQYWFGISAPTEAGILYQQLDNNNNSNNNNGSEAEVNPTITIIRKQCFAWTTSQAVDLKLIPFGSYGSVRNSITQKTEGLIKSQHDIIKPHICLNYKMVFCIYCDAITTIYGNINSLNSYIIQPPRTTQVLSC